MPISELLVVGSGVGGGGWGGGTQTDPSPAELRRTIPSGRGKRGNAAIRTKASSLFQYKPFRDLRCSNENKG